MVARGKVWELRLEAAEAQRLPPGSLIVDQLPEADGRVRLRVLHHEPPHPRATPTEPSLEEGYLLLVGGDRKEAAA
jgi:hypothetical protein